MMQRRIALLFAVLYCTLSAIFASAQTSKPYAELVTIPFFRLLAHPPRLTHAQEVTQDNELVPNSIGQSAQFAANPLQINGKSLDYDNFGVNTRGILTLVKGDPASKDGQLIPFNVYIRRNGKILEDKKMLFLGKVLFEVNLSDIFPFGQDGDVLIVNPVRAEDWKAKRILKYLRGC
jgi:hypothetical protein